VHAARQNFLDLQEAVEKTERHTLEQNYEALDEMVSLDFRALMLRQGKTVSVGSLRPLPKPKSALPSVRRYRELSGEDKIGQPKSLSSCRNDTAQPDSVASSAKQPSSKKKLPKLTRSSSKLEKKSAIEDQATSYCTQQLEALTALVTAMDTGKPLEDILCSISRSVLTHLGTKAFTAEQCSRTMATIFKERSLSQKSFISAQKRVELAVEGLCTAAQEVGMHFVDVVGQILWHNRGALPKKKHKETAEDLSWAMLNGVEDALAPDHLSGVDEAFEMLCSENGRMNSRSWRQAARIVASSPEIGDRVNFSDVDRLWFAQTRSHTSGIRQDITCQDFKSLLLALGEAMQVHPWMVFFPVASFAKQSCPLPSPLAASKPSPLRRSSTANKLSLPLSQLPTRCNSPAESRRSSISSSRSASTSTLSSTATSIASTPALTPLPSPPSSSRASEMSLDEVSMPIKVTLSLPLSPNRCDSSADSPRPKALVA
jgi:hypothetical protein